MSSAKGLVLDANILMRAVLGQAVRKLLEKYEGSVSFYSPDVCFEDTRHYLTTKLLKEKGIKLKAGLAVLNRNGGIVQRVEHKVYADYEHRARKRVEMRDADDWPVAALALLLELPIWTEDKDFFGSGIPTWTSDRVEIYLKA